MDDILHLELAFSFTRGHDLTTVAPNAVSLVFAQRCMHARRIMRANLQPLKAMCTPPHAYSYVHIYIHTSEGYVHVHSAVYMDLAYLYMSVHTYMIP